MRTLGGVVMRIRTYSSLALSMIVVGCSIHPLPKDVTRDTTLEIINKIRCETRRALVERVKVVLEEEHSPTNQSLLEKLKQPGGASEEMICNLHPAAFDEAASKRINKFAASTIAYTYKFTILEHKAKSGTANFRLPFTKGNFTLGLTAGSDKKRQNLRSITFGDIFSSLITGRHSDGRPTGLNCESVGQPRKHWIYPITGKIGMAEVVNTYIDLAKISKRVDTFSDTLTFTTKINVGADPKVTLTRFLPKKFSLADASASYAADRTDEHEVGLVLKTPDPKKPAAKKNIKITHTIVEENFSEKIPEIGIAVKKLSECKFTKPNCAAGLQPVCGLVSNPKKELELQWTCKPKPVDPNCFGQMQACTNGKVAVCMKAKEAGGQDEYECKYKKCNVLEERPEKITVKRPKIVRGRTFMETIQKFTGQMIKSPFVVSPELEERSLSEAISESRRLEDVSRQSDIDRLIGR